MIKKIVISGVGGQGIKLMSFSLSNILSTIGYNVSLMFDYDSAMRGGSIIAFLSYSDKEIDNPIIEEVDILLKLSECDDNIVAKKIICETGFCEDVQVPFKEISKQKFGNVKVVNMLALGFLLRLINVNLNKIDLKNLLPEKNGVQNIEAIKYFYNLRNKGKDF